MKYTLLLVAFLVGGVALAQQPMKFGHINSQEVLMAMPEIKEIETALEAEQKLKEDQLTTMNEELRNAQQVFMEAAETMSPEERTAKQQELQQMNQKAQNFYMLAQQQLQAKQNELMAPVVQKIKAAIQEVGDENGFLYIFEVASNVPVYRSEKSEDVAPLVKAKLGITN
jgi:outer membrane protein